MTAEPEVVVITGGSAGLGRATARADAFTSLYRRSLLIVRAHADHGGRIVAATDFDTTQFARDTCAYIWPRDGSLAAGALIEAGYSHVPEGFFDSCHSTITPEGYMLHKFNLNGSLASTWHGWSYQGKKTLPVQEDETALVLWALRLHCGAGICGCVPQDACRFSPSA